MSSSLIEQLHLNYQASLKEKAHQLHELWSDEDKNSDHLLKFLHRIAGSAGMYGFDEISTLAVKMQSSLKGKTPESQLKVEFDKLYKLLVETSTN